MKKTINTKLTLAIIFTLLFAALTVLATKIDYAPAGETDEYVGFSTINTGIFEFFGGKLNEAWYGITQYLGYLSIAVAALFALIGLSQLIKRKSFKKVDVEIIELGALFIIVIALYFLFDKFALNFRPVYMPGKDVPEASFPSSHTLLVCSVFGGVMMILKKFISNKPAKILLQVLCASVIAVMVIGRLLSCVHWASDILASLLLSAALLLGTAYDIERLNRKRAAKPEE